jgi:hypothetical protein
VGGAGLRADSRSARAVLCVGVGVVGLAVVVIVVARPPRDFRAAPPDAGRTVAAPALTTGGGDVAVVGTRTPQAAMTPLAARTRRDDPDVAAGLARWDSPSFDLDDPRNRGSAARGLDGLTPEGFAPHRHLAAEETSPGEARAPAPVLAGAAPGGTSPPSTPGWDGGDFWFGPNGLVRMREAQP